ncbi:MAG: hypothetical protein CYPHOPRED_001336 [Cyphobasidiales sp. Tagirdzhanova-0007]|nr:MAG: hypothetical protein CYPHOPRED_001336 [Cyphobasidiales sp. Tagirdzhanova-0007]
MEESTGALTELASATLDYDQYMQAQENMLLDLDNQLYEDTEQENFQLRTDPTSPEPHLPRSPPLPEHPKSLGQQSSTVESLPRVNVDKVGQSHKSRQRFQQDLNRREGPPNPDVGSDAENYSISHSDDKMSENEQITMGKNFAKHVLVEKWGHAGATHL